MNDTLKPNIKYYYYKFLIQYGIINKFKNLLVFICTVVEKSASSKLCLNE